MTDGKCVIRSLYLVMKNVVLEEFGYVLLVLGLDRLSRRGLQVVVLGDKVPNIPLEY